jgi:hypothetical protein
MIKKKMFFLQMAVYEVPVLSFCKMAVVSSCWAVNKSETGYEENGF